MFENNDCPVCQNQRTEQDKRTKCKDGERWEFFK